VWRRRSAVSPFPLPDGGIPSHRGLWVWRRPAYCGSDRPGSGNGVSPITYRTPCWSNSRMNSRISGEKWAASMLCGGMRVHLAKPDHSIAPSARARCAGGLAVTTRHSAGCPSLPLAASFWPYLPSAPCHNMYQNRSVWQTPFAGESLPLRWRARSGPRLSFSDKGLSLVNFIAPATRWRRRLRPAVVFSLDRQRLTAKGQLRAAIAAPRLLRPAPLIVLLTADLGPAQPGNRPGGATSARHRGGGSPTGSPRRHRASRARRRRGPRGPSP